MSKAFARGACPCLAAPMETGDGLLARLVPAGPMLLPAFAVLCAAAETHGNGIIEISARGSLQVRGLTPGSAPLFAAAIEALDIPLCDGMPVLADPLPGEASALIDAQTIAAALRQAIATQRLSFAPKVSVIVDGGGRLHLDALAADIRLRAVPMRAAPRLHLSLAGDAASATPLGMISARDVVESVMRLLMVLAAHGPDVRVADVLRHDGIGAFRAAVADRLEPAGPLPARRPAEPIGLHRLKAGHCAMGVALAFGQARAKSLAALAGIAAANGAAWAAIAPGRALLLGPIGEMTGFALATAADQLGFVVDARDARRRVVACPGAPACASGLIAARELAAVLVPHLAPGDGVAVHVSGCAKGCAYPAEAPLTVVGTESGCGIVHDGTARERPERVVETRDLAAEVGKLQEAVNA